MENIVRINNIKKNLIDLLKIKTTIIFKQFNKEPDIYYDYNSIIDIKNDNVKITKFNSYDIIKIHYKNFIQSYYISTIIVKDIIIPNDEYTYPEWIIYSYTDTNIKDEKIKMGNYYSLSFLSIHYSTCLIQNNLKIELLDSAKYMCYYNILTKNSNNKIVSNISDDTKEFNLFYHPNYFNEYNIYGYIYTGGNLLTCKDYAYRIREIKNNK